MHPAASCRILPHPAASCRRKLLVVFAQNEYISNYHWLRPVYHCELGQFQR